MGRYKYYVGSSVYNLAGDEKDRPNFRKLVTTGRVMSGSKEGFGETLVNALLSGPGVKHRGYFNWAKSNYVYGLPKSQLKVMPNIPMSLLETGMLPDLSLAPNVTVKALTSVIDRAEAGYWHDAWLRENRPDLVDVPSSAVKTLTGDFLLDFGTETIAITMPADYFWGSDAAANLISSRLILYVLYQTITTTTTMISTIESVFNDVTMLYEDVEILTPDVTTEVSGIKLYTYRVGSGKAVFDNIIALGGTKEDYFPTIPLRWYDKSIRDPAYSDTFPNVKKAYQKLTGGKIDDIIDQLEENESIGDIDYAFVGQGVSLSAKDQASLGYLYHHFDTLRVNQQGSLASLNQYGRDLLQSQMDEVTQNRWLWATDPENPLRAFHPLQAGAELGAPADPKVRYDLLKNTERCYNPGMPSYDQTITWNWINFTSHVGNAKKQGTRHAANTRLKIRHYWSEVLPDLSVDTGITVPNASDDRYDSWAQLQNVNLNRIAVYYQYSEFRYHRMEIIGLNHRNNVYNGHSVNITGKEALTDGTPNEPSGFLVPIHYPTLRSMNLLKGTELSIQSNHMIINTLFIYKKKWYETGLFKVILFVIIIAISIYFPPVGAGLLGTNAAVGAAVGFTLGSTTALVAGAVINALASMVVSSLITKISTKLFGEKLGAIIGTIATFALNAYAGQYHTHGDFAVDWGSMMRADNLLKITDSMGAAYTQWLNADTKDVYTQMGKSEKEYKNDMDRIAKAAEEFLGDGSNLIDPMLLTDSTLIYPESSETFLSRTLLTGSDIAALSFSFIEDFPELSKELPTSFA